MVTSLGEFKPDHTILNVCMHAAEDCLWTQTPTKTPPMDLHIWMNTTSNMFRQLSFVGGGAFLTNLMDVTTRNRYPIYPYDLHLTCSSYMYTTISFNNPLYLLYILRFVGWQMYPETCTIISSNQIYTNLDLLLFSKYVSINNLLSCQLKQLKGQM